MNVASDYVFSLCTNFTESLYNYLSYGTVVSHVPCCIDFSDDKYLISQTPNNNELNTVLIKLNGIFPGNLFFKGLPNNGKPIILIIKFENKGVFYLNNLFDIKNHIGNLAEKFISVTLDNIDNIDAYFGDIVPTNFVYNKTFRFKNSIISRYGKTYSYILSLFLKDKYEIHDITRDDCYVTQYTTL